VQNGRVVLEKHYGDKGVDTLFSLMSSTKLLVSLLTLRLQDRGLLSVDDAVEKYIPEYAHIKVLQIVISVSDTSGLPSEVQSLDVAGFYGIFG